MRLLPRRWICVCAAAFVLASCLHASGEPQGDVPPAQTGLRPSVAAGTLAGPIRLDGVLDEPV